mmetsp:Transcript_15971/g.17733  ORF Transcript_15971/g.17733 Transcript_15971/m.17733 type:complete len:271 (+) Transcript_15971:62-874(+)
MRVHIRTIKHYSTYTFDIEDKDTIHSLKKKFQAEVGIPLSLQRLFFAGDELSDSKRVGDYNIKDGATINFVQGQKPKPQANPLAFGKTSVFGVRGRAWKVSRFNGGNITVNKATMGQGVDISFCKNTNVTIPRRVAHLSIVACDNCVVRFNGVISSLEITRCHNLTVIQENESTVSTIQIDLSENVNLQVNDSTVAHGKIITSSTTDLRIRNGTTEFDVPMSFFVQEVTHWDVHEHKLRTIGINNVKKNGNGYAIIADLDLHESGECSCH